MIRNLFLASKDDMRLGIKHLMTLRCAHVYSTASLATGRQGLWNEVVLERWKGPCQPALPAT